MTEQGNYGIWCKKEDLPQFLRQITGEIREVDAPTITSKDELMSTIAAAMDFPDYFSGNWDSFDECLADLELPESSLSVTLVIHNADQIFSVESVGTFFSIFGNAAVEWGERQEKLSLKMVLEGEANSDATTILEAAGIGKR